MKTSTVVGIGAALLLLPLLAKFLGGSSVNLVFNKVKGFDFKNFNLVLTLQFKIQNPTNQQFQLNALNGDLSINGTTVGNAAVFTAITIPPVSEVLYDVPITLQTIGLVSDLVEILNGNSSRKLSLNFKGNANVDKYVIPFNQSFTI